MPKIITLGSADTHSGGPLTSNSVVLGAGGGDTKTVTAFTTDGAAQMTIGVAGGGNGVLGLAGNTSGTATLTAPAVAGTTTNPIVVSNAIQVPAGLSVLFGGTTNSFPGIKRSSANLVARLADDSADTQVNMSVLGLDGATSGTVTMTPPAVAGTAVNPILCTNSFQIPIGTVFQIGTAGGGSSGGISCPNGTILFGNGTNGNASATVQASIVQTGSNAGVFDPFFAMSPTGLVTWAGSGNFTNARDTSLSRQGAKVVQVGDGAANSNGTILATSLQSATGNVTGVWQNVNVTPVTVSANVSTDQNLMSVSVPAGTLNSVGKTIRYHCSGVYSTEAANASTITIKVKLGSLTLVSITSAANAGGVTNDKWYIDGEFTTQTSGSSAKWESDGKLAIDISSAVTAAMAVYADSNTAVSSTADSTAALTLQITGTFSVAGAAAGNIFTQRKMTLESIN